MKLVAVTGRKMQEADEGGLPFGERADRGALVLPDNQVPFTVPCLRTVLGRERALVDGEHRLGEPRPSPLDALLRTTMVPARAQR